MFFPRLTFLLSYPLESMMELKEAAESKFENIGKTTLFSTLDSCKGSKLRKVEIVAKLFTTLPTSDLSFTDVEKVKECPLDFQKKYLGQF